MTLEETKQFLNLLYINFPNAFKHIQDKENLDMVANLWQANFSKINAQEMAMGLNDYLSSGVNVATPSLGQLLGDMKKIIYSNIDYPQLCFYEVWDMIIRNAKINPTYARQNFEKLPPIVKKTLGGYSALCDIGASTYDQNQYKKAHYQKVFNDLAKEEIVNFQCGKITLEQIAINSNKEELLGIEREESKRIGTNS